MKQEEFLQSINSTQLAQTSTESSEEKRRHPRIPVSLEVEIVDTRTGVHITGRATDVGVGGCYVDTMNTFAEGTRVDVILHWQQRNPKLRGLVSYAVNDRGIGMGVSFTDMSPQEGATLLD